MSWAMLGKLDAVVGTCVKPEAAIIYDYQNQWAIEAAKFGIQENLKYQESCIKHYLPFWKQGICAQLPEGVSAQAHPKSLVKATR